MARDRIPKIVVVGVGPAASDVLRHLDPDVGRVVWIVRTIANRDLDGAPVDAFVHVKPPPSAVWGMGVERRWGAFAREGLAIGGARRLIRTADLLVIVGGLDPLTRLVLEAPGRPGAVRVLFCLTRLSKTGKSVRGQKGTLESCSRLAGTVIHVPVVPARNEVQTQDPPYAIEPDVCRMIARAVSGLCALLILPPPGERVSLAEARRFFSKGRFGGMAVASVPVGPGVEAAVARAFDDRVSGGFSIPQARKVWLSIEGGSTLEKRTADACLEGLSSSGAHPRRASSILGRVARHRGRRRKIFLSLLAIGFERPSRNPTPLPSTLERAEEKAGTLLERLLPDQAERYRRRGFIDVKSSLHESWTYRIHRSDDPFATEILRDGKRQGLLCLQFRKKQFPPTDRVLAEYMLVRDDEEEYLRTENVRLFRRELVGARPA